MDDLRVVKLNRHRFPVLKTEPEIRSNPINLCFGQAKGLDSIKSPNLLGSHRFSSSLRRRGSASTEQQAHKSESGNHASPLTLSHAGPRDVNREAELKALPGVGLQRFFRHRVILLLHASSGQFG